MSAGLIFDVSVLKRLFLSEQDHKVSDKYHLSVWFSF